jgi:hypothetical protein
MAAVLLTAGWAAAQAPAPSLVLPDPYLSPSPPAIEGNAAPSGYAPSARLAADGPDLFPAPYRVWTSGDFLVWKLRNAPLPPLVAAVPVGVIQVQATDTFVTSTLATLTINQTLPPAPVSIQSTATVADGNKLNLGEQFGARFTAGVWLDADESVGLESTFFFINRRTAGFHSGTDNTNAQSTIDLAATNNLFFLTPSTTTTTITMGTTTRTTTTSTITLTPVNAFAASAVSRAVTDVTGTGSTEMWGAELNARCTAPSLGAVSGLVGFRYLDLHENLGVRDSLRLSSTDINSNFPTELNYNTADAIRTQNYFYGGQVGLDLDMYLGRLIADLRFKTALGVMHQTVNVLGTTIEPDGTVQAGGLLSSPFDTGNHSRNHIAFVPEINVKLGYQILPSLRAYVGYDFLYLSSVVQPGDQVGASSTSIQATVAGTNSQITVSPPAFRYKATDMTINGINFGAEFRY